MAGKKGTWSQALISLFLPVFLILVLRWIFFEPYVIPSGSMEPTLLQHDYILVNKFAFGFRLPFGQQWLFKVTPARGDVIVFRSPDEPEIFFIKRVVGIPGDRISFRQGQLILNDRLISEPVQTDGERQVWQEQLDGHTYRVFLEDRIVRGEDAEESSPLTIPAEHLFVAGDNRHHSSDSRVWGLLNTDKLIGRAVLIWMSCDTAENSISLCAPENLRRDRLLKAIQ